MNTKKETATNVAASSIHSTTLLSIRRTFPFHSLPGRVINFSISSGILASL